MIFKLYAFWASFNIKPGGGMLHVSFRKSLRITVAFLISILFFSFAYAEKVVTKKSVRSYVNIRSSPSVDNNSIGKLRPGERLNYAKSVAQWHEVRLRNGQSGYVSKTWTKVIPDSEVIVTSSTVADHSLNISTGDYDTLCSAYIWRSQTDGQYTMASELPIFYEIILSIFNKNNILFSEICLLFYNYVWIRDDDYPYSRSIEFTPSQNYQVAVQAPTNFDDAFYDYIGVRVEVEPKLTSEPISSILFIAGGATLGLRRLWKKRKPT
jgi:hypothetical protein